ncbi:hypothetical protein BBK82_32415 [Lentzea guizhouensis]|uniref:Uncharacterized protein n=1 Tax=Lentzea guizhouensis TaxID=1586287 RepID=A0A1B2HQN8_9PSEU|nr:hypothetical protein [Lentzea guizhouensis]ANZ40044.1 hypothetical protein BBK82_32415 [Lentzea guizhouensis]
MTSLSAAWRELGELTGAELDGVPPVHEVSLLPQPVRLGRAHGYDGVRSLADLTPLLMLFDRGLAVRRDLRDRFVVEFGHGGAAASPPAHPCCASRSRARRPAASAPAVPRWPTWWPAA